MRGAGALMLAALVAGCSLGSAHGATASLASGHRPCTPADTAAVVQQVNATRQRAGLRPLGNDSHLASFARGRSAAMAAENRLSHRGWNHALRDAGFDDGALGENVAFNYTTPTAVMRGWLASPGHRANILRREFRRIGVGCVIDEHGHRWWTQDFAG